MAKATAQSVIDTYIYKRTTDLIQVLQNFVRREKRYQATDFYLKHRLEEKTFSSASQIAEDSLSFFVNLRKQIGGEDTTPKGLLILFMHHLCSGLTRCREILTSPSHHQLSGVLCAEISVLYEQYPDLAKAGEMLHNAEKNIQIKRGYKEGVLERRWQLT